MRRQLWVLVALAALFSMLVIAPATAKKPVHGVQTMLLNQIPGDPEAPPVWGLYGCDKMSWFGEVIIDGKPYGMALYPDTDTRFAGMSAIMIYVESWKIFSGEFTLADGDPLKIDSCEPGTVLLAGSDHGMAHFDTGVFHSNGKVTEAVTPFDEWMNRRVMQKGTMGLVEFDGAVGVGFLGSTRLN